MTIPMEKIQHMQNNLLLPERRKTLHFMPMRCTGVSRGDGISAVNRLVNQTISLAKIVLKSIS